jgi:hypothetical protein
MHSTWDHEFWRQNNMEKPRLLLGYTFQSSVRTLVSYTLNRLTLVLGEKKRHWSRFSVFQLLVLSPAVSPSIFVLVERIHIGRPIPYLMVELSRYHLFFAFPAGYWCYIMVTNGLLLVERLDICDFCLCFSATSMPRSSWGRTAYFQKVSTPLCCIIFLYSLQFCFLFFIPFFSFRKLFIFLHSCIYSRVHGMNWTHVARQYGTHRPPGSPAISQIFF